MSGHIALIRYGSIFRGSKVRIAQRFGVIGIVFFNDPREKAREGRDFTFPQSWWMPGLGVESGTTFDLEGDPLTPFYPAIGIFLPPYFLCSSSGVHPSSSVVYPSLFFSSTSTIFSLLYKKN